MLVNHLVIHLRIGMKTMNSNQVDQINIIFNNMDKDI